MADNLIYHDAILLPSDVQIFLMTNFSCLLFGTSSSVLADDISLSKADKVLLTFSESETRYTTMSSIPLSIRIFNGMLRGQETPSLVFTSDTEEESDIFLTSLPTASPNVSSGVPQQNEFDVVAPPWWICSDNQADAILNKFVLIVYRANGIFAITIFLVYNFFWKSCSKGEFPRDYLRNVTTCLFAHIKIDIKQWTKICLNLSKSWY